MTVALPLLALVLIPFMVVWLIRDLAKTLRMPNWPTRKDEAP